MLSIIGLLSLLCALTAGIFGVDSTPEWTWGKGSFVMFLMLAVAAFLVSTLRRPSLFWEVVDDYHGRRFRNSHTHESSRSR
jgi:hypothetical protein